MDTPNGVSRQFDVSKGHWFGEWSLCLVAEDESGYFSGACLPDWQCSYWEDG